MPKRPRRKRQSVAFNPIDVHVGNRVRTRRTLLGMSQTALGEAIGLTFQQVQKYERGFNRLSASRLFDVSRILDVDIEYFFEDIDGATAKASPAQAAKSKAQQSAKAPPKSENPLQRRETLELVRAYYKISDPGIRDHVRKLVSSAAAASPGSD